LDDTLSGFPFEKARPVQTKAIQAIWKHFSEGKKIVVLEAPTGTGKSGIGLTIARAFESVYYATAQKILQDQYTREFGGTAMTVLKGRNAYQCSYGETHCDEAPCMVNKELRKLHPECSYTQAVQKALAAPIMLCNFDSLYYQYKFGWFLGKKRELLVVDEGHLIESKFMSFVEVKLQTGQLPSCRSLPPEARGDNTSLLLPFLKRCWGEAAAEVESYEGAQTITKAQARRLQTLSSLVSKLDTLLVDLPVNPTGWVHQIEHGFRGDALVVKPVFVDKWVQQDLFSCADKVLIMSATIVSIEHWASSLGVNRDDVAFIRSDSPFPIENRPIHLRYVGSMSMKNVQETLPKAMGEVRALLEEHQGERGIIHTHSYKLEQAIRNSIKDSRLTYKNGDVNAMLAEHERKSDSVIVAPGLAEGLDLKEELSRFQIVLKVPYPSLGDPQMKRRFELSKSYYGFRTMLTLVQEYGRSVRSETDHAETYVLDSDFERFRKMNAAMMPKWFSDAIVEDDED